MPIDEDFFNAEFYKFLGKINRMLAVSDKEVLHFSYSKPGFVEIAIWDSKANKADNFFVNISKEGAFLDETVHEVHE